ncbi:DUF378 domain-containing protein [Neobacillus mesonae]|uniref:DUF378 domain-containing protein n=1 Tax=Neobacillus mesonae TaxID=1193713 RepID=UPI002E2127BD|nr:DUF378 domain-containing protein [Neobacillus mesonae]
MRTLQKIALALVIIGAINWGLIGFFRFDLVAAIFGGQGSFLARVVYGLVGLSGLVCLSILFAPIRQENHKKEQINNRNLKYATEFGEENDLSEYKKD